MVPFFELQTIGPLYTFAVMSVLGFVTAGTVSVGLAWREGRSVWPSLAFVLGLLVVVLPAGRLYYLVLYAPDQLGLTAVFQVWAGVSSIGALVSLPLVVLVAALLDWRNLGAQLDGLVLGIASGLVPFRLGCTLIHDHVGPPSSAPLALRGICPEHVQAAACHDVGLYALLLVLGFLALCGGLMAWSRRPPGLIAACGPLVYAIGSAGIGLSVFGELATWLALPFVLGVTTLVAVGGVAFATDGPERPAPEGPFKPPNDRTMRATPGCETRSSVMPVTLALSGGRPRGRVDGSTPRGTGCTSRSSGSPARRRTGVGR